MSDHGYFLSDHLSDPHFFSLSNFLSDQIGANLYQIVYQYISFLSSQTFYQIRSYKFLIRLFIRSENSYQTFYQITEIFSSNLSVFQFLSIKLILRPVSLRILYLFYVSRSLTLVSIQNTEISSPSFLFIAITIGYYNKLNMVRI